jgi:hypothetical protein
MFDYGGRDLLVAGRQQRFKLNRAAGFRFHRGDPNCLALFDQVLFTAGSYDSM